VGLREVEGGPFRAKGGQGGEKDGVLREGASVKKHILLARGELDESYGAGIGKTKTKPAYRLKFSMS